MEMLTGGAALALVGVVTGERIPLDARRRVAFAGVFHRLRPLVAFSLQLAARQRATRTEGAGCASRVLTGEPLGITTLVANGLIVLAVMLAPQPDS
jgi:hypothetical protein